MSDQSKKDNPNEDRSNDDYKSPKSIFTEHHGIRFNEKFVLKLAKGSKNVNKEVKDSCRVLHFSSEWNFEEVLTAVGELDSKNYPYAFVFIIEATNFGFTAEHQQYFNDKFVKLQEKLLKFGSTRPIIIQFTSEHEKVTRIYYKDETSAQFLSIDQQQEESKENDSRSFLKSFLDHDLNDYESKVLGTLPQIQNRSLILRLLRTTNLPDEFFGSVLLKIVTIGTKAELVAALDSPFDSYGRTLSLRSQKYISDVFEADDDNDPENDDSVLLTAIEHKNTEVIDYLITYWSHLIQQLPFYHQVRISTAAFVKNQLDVLCDLLEIADFPFPEDYEFDDKQEHERLQKIILQRMGFTNAIKRENFKKIDQFIGSNLSLRYAFGINNKTALTQAINLKKFGVFYYLKSLGFQGEDNKEFLNKLNEKERKEATMQAFKQRKQQYDNKLVQNVYRSVLLLATRSLIHNKRISKEHEAKYRQTILNWLQDIHKIAPEMLDVAASCEHLKIIFDFESDTVEATRLAGSNSSGSMYQINKWIFVGAKLSDRNGNVTKQREQKIKGVLAHELCHYVMQLVYENQEKPYYKHRKDEKEFFTQIVRVIDKWSATKSRDPDDECNGIISTVFTLYSKEEFSLELIVRVVQILTEYDDDEDKSEYLQHKYHLLFNFWYSHVVPELQIYFKTNKEIKKLNGFAELLPKIIKHKIEVNRSKEIEELIANKLSIVTTNIPNLLFVNICKILKEKYGILMDFRSFFMESVKVGDLKFRKAFNQICRDVHELNIFVDCTKGVPFYLGEIFVNNELNFTFIVSNESQCQELMNICDEKGIKNATKVPPMNYNWNDLTEESQKLLLQTKIKFQNNSQITLLDLLKVKEPPENDAGVNLEKGLLKDLSEIVDDQLLNLMMYNKESSINSAEELDLNEKYFKIINKSRNFLRKEKYNNNQSDSNQTSENIAKIFQDELLLEVKNKKFVLISDKAGNGKSWAMTNITKILREQNPTRWVTYVDLKQFIQEFKAHRAEPEFSSFMVENILKLKQKFESKIFQRLYKDGKVSVLFDGFDEIAPHCAEFVTKLAQSFQSNEGNQLWIATRDYFEVDLQEKLQLDVSYGLDEMSEEDGIDLIAKCWMLMDLSVNKKMNSVEKFEEFIKSSPDFDNYKQRAAQIVKNVGMSFDRSIGLPQMFKMIADGFKGKQDLSNLSQSKIYLKFILNLYRRWSDGKGQIRMEASVESQKLKLIFWKFHQYHAIASLFPELVKILFPGYDGSEWPAEEIIACGIMIIIDGKIYFIHETIREYFVADFILKLLKNPGEETNILLNLLLKILTIKKFLIVRIFLNDFFENAYDSKAMEQSLQKIVPDFYKNIDKLLNLSEIFEENLEHLVDFAIQIFKNGTNADVKRIFSNNMNIFVSAAKHERLLIKLQDYIRKNLDPDYLMTFLSQKDENGTWIIFKLLNCDSFYELEDQLTREQMRGVLLLKGRNSENLLNFAARNIKDLENLYRLWKLYLRYFSEAEILEILKSVDTNGHNIIHNSVCNNSTDISKFLFVELKMFLPYEEFKNLSSMKDAKGRNVLQFAASQNKSLENFKKAWNFTTYLHDPSEISELISSKDNDLIVNAVKNSTDDIISYIFEKVFSTIKDNSLESHFSQLGTNLLEAYQSCQNKNDKAGLISNLKIIIHEAERNTAKYKAVENLRSQNSTKDIKWHKKLWIQLLEAIKSENEIKELMLEKYENEKNYIHVLVSNNTAEVLQFTLNKLKDTFQLHPAFYKEIIMSTGFKKMNLLQSALCSTKELKMYDELWVAVRENPEMINHTDEEDKNVLHYAIEYGDDKLLELTLREINSFDKMFEELLTQIDKNGKTALQMCIDRKDPQKFKVVWDKIFKYNQTNLLKSPTNDDRNMLHLCSSNENIEFHKILWEPLKDESKIRNDSNRVKLHDLILQKDRHDNNYVHLLLVNNSSKIVSYTMKEIHDTLGDEMFKKILKSKGKYKRSILEIAARDSKDKETYQYVFQRIFDSYETMDVQTYIDECNLLKTDLSKGNEKEEDDKYIKKGALITSINKIQKFRDVDGCNLLMVAIRNRSIDELRLIEKYNFDVDDVDDYQLCTIDHAWNWYIKEMGLKNDGVLSKEILNIMMTLLEKNSRLPSDLVRFDFEHAPELIANFIEKCEISHKYVIDDNIKGLKQELKKRKNLNQFYNRDNISLIQNTLKLKKFDIFDLLVSRNMGFGNFEELKQIYEGLTIQEKMNIKKQNIDYAKEFPEDYKYILNKNPYVRNNDKYYKDRKKEIEKAFNIINDYDSFKIILQIAAAWKKTRILFDFTNDFIHSIDPTNPCDVTSAILENDLILIGAKKMLAEKTKLDVISELTKNLYRLALKVTFMNNYNPFPMGKSNEKRKFQEEVLDEYKTYQSSHEAIKNVFDNESNDHQNSERIITVVEMIIHKNQSEFSQLYAYHKDVVLKEMENALKVLERLQNDKYEIAFADLTKPMQAKIMHTNIVLRGTEIMLNKIIENDEEILACLRSVDIRDILLRDIKLTISDCSSSCQREHAVDRKFVEFEIDSRSLIRSNSIQEYGKTFRKIKSKIESSRIFALVEATGAGKSTTLQQLISNSKEVKKDFWISVIEPKTQQIMVTECLKRCNVQNEITVETVLKFISELSNIKMPIEDQLLRKLFNRNKFILIVDGIDEVSNENSTTILNIIDYILKNSRNQIWISLHPQYYSQFKKHFEKRSLKSLEETESHYEAGIQLVNGFFFSIPSCLEWLYAKVEKFETIEPNSIIKYEFKIQDQFPPEFNESSLNPIFDESISVILIFMSTAKLNILIFWKVYGEKQFHSLQLNSSDENVAEFCCNFLIEELKYNKNGLLEKSKNKEKIGVTDLGIEDESNLLMYAVESNHFEIIKYLLKYNFNINYENIKNQNAINFAWINYINTQDPVVKENTNQSILNLLNANSKFPSKECGFVYERSSSELKNFVDMCKSLHNHAEHHEIQQLTTILQENSHLRYFFNTDNESLLLHALKLHKLDVLNTLKEKLSVERSESLVDAYYVPSKCDRKEYLSVLPDYYIAVLKSKSSVMICDNNEHEKWMLVDEAFTTINKDQICQIILKTAALCNNLNILFDFTKNSEHYKDSVQVAETIYDSGTIYIGSKDLLTSHNKMKTIGMLIYELALLAISMVFMNNFHPYPINDTESIDRFETEVLKEYKEKLEVASKSETQARQHSECIPSFLKQLVENIEKTRKTEENYPAMFRFLSQRVKTWMDESLPMLKILQNQELTIKFKNLPLSMKSKVLHSRINFQNTTTSFFKLIGEDNEILNQLSSQDIRKILHNDEFSINCHSKISKTIERKFLIVGKNEHDFTAEKVIKEMNVNGDNKIFILSGIGGSGKTSTFIDLVREFNQIEKYKNWWTSVIFIERHRSLLKHFSQNYINEKIGEINITKIEELLIEILGLKNIIDVLVFKKLFNTGRVVLLIDGMDEIVPDFSNIFNRLLQTISKKTKIQLLIAARPKNAQDIARDFSTKEFKFKPLTIEERNEIIQKNFEILPNISKESIENLFKIIEDGRMYNIDNPLFITTLLELCSSNQINLSPNLLNLYKLFQKLLNELSHKLHSRIEHHNIFSFESFTIEEVYQVYALKLVFNQAINSWNYNKNGININDLAIISNWKGDSYQWTSEKIQRHGILTVDIEITFIHQSIAEFFVAEYIISYMFEHNRSIRDGEYEKVFNVLRYVMKKGDDFEIVRKCLIGYVNIGTDKKENLYEVVGNLIDKHIIDIRQEILEKPLNTLEFWSIFIINEPEKLKDLWNVNQKSNLIQKILTENQNHVSNNISKFFEIICTSFGKNWHETFNKSDDQLIIDDIEENEHSEYKFLNNNLLKLLDLAEKNFSNYEIQTIFNIITQPKLIKDIRVQILIKCISIQLNIYQGANSILREFISKFINESENVEIINYLGTSIENIFSKDRKIIRELLFPKDCINDHPLYKFCLYQDNESFVLFKNLYTKYKNTWDELREIFKFHQDLAVIFEHMTTTVYPEFKSFLIDIFRSDRKAMIDCMQTKSNINTNSENIEILEDFLYELFDEDYSESIKTILKNFLSNDLEYKEESQENGYKIESYKFAPLTSKEKEDFVEHILINEKYSSTKNNIKNIIKLIEKSGDLDNLLTIETIVDLYESNSFNSNDSYINLYNIFEKIIVTICKKIENPLLYNFTFKMVHEVMSLKFIFNQNCKSQLNFNLDDLSIIKQWKKSKSIYWNPKKIQKYGIITVKSDAITEGFEPQEIYLIHKSYGEFFVAQFIIKYIFDEFDKYSSNELMLIVNMLNFVGTEMNDFHNIRRFIIDFMKINKDSMLNEYLINLLIPKIENIQKDILGSENMLEMLEFWTQLLSRNPEVSKKLWQLGETDNLLKSIVCVKKFKNNEEFLNILNIINVTFGSKWHESFNKSGKDLITDDQIECLETSEEVKAFEKNIIKFISLISHNYNSREVDFAFNNYIYNQVIFKEETIEKFRKIRNELLRTDEEIATDGNGINDCQTDLQIEPQAELANSYVETPSFKNRILSWFR